MWQLSSSIGAIFVIPVVMLSIDNALAELPSLPEAKQQLSVRSSALLKRFDGVAWRASVRLTRPGSVVISERELTYMQLRDDLWCLDVSGEQTFSIQRDRDFWFSTIERLPGGCAYDRLGFDDAAEMSIEGSRFAQNLLLSSNSHVLELTLADFVGRPGMTFSEPTASVEPPNELQLDWVFKPEDVANAIPAHGTLHWRMEESVPLITQYQYWFGRPEKPNPKGVTCTVEYDQWNGHSIPVRAVQTDNGVQTVVERLEIKAAEQNESLYTPEAKGLSRPVRPTEKWKIWSMAALVLAAAWYFLFRTEKPVSVANKIS